MQNPTSTAAASPAPGDHHEGYSEEYELNLKLREYAAALGVASIGGNVAGAGDGEQITWAACPWSPEPAGDIDIEPDPRRRGSDTARHCAAKTTSQGGEEGKQEDSSPTAPPGAKRRHRAQGQRQRRERARDRDRDHRHAGVNANTFYLPPLLSESELEGVVLIRSPPRLAESKSSPVGNGNGGTGIGTGIGSNSKNNSRNEDRATSTSPLSPSHSRESTTRLVKTQTQSTLRKVSSFFACCPTDPFEDSAGVGCSTNTNANANANGNAKGSLSSPTDHEEPHWIASFKTSQADAHQAHGTLRKRPSAAVSLAASAAELRRGADTSRTHTLRTITPSPGRDVVREDIFSQAVVHSLGLFPVAPERQRRHPSSPRPPPAQIEQLTEGSSHLSSNPRVPFPLQWFAPSARSASSEEFPAWPGSSEHLQVRPTVLARKEQPKPNHPLDGHDNNEHERENDNNNDNDDRTNDGKFRFKYTWHTTEADDTEANWLGLVDADQLSEMSDPMDVQFGPLNMNMNVNVDIGLPRQTEPTIDRVIEWLGHVSPVLGPLDQQ